MKLIKSRGPIAHVEYLDIPGMYFPGSDKGVLGGKVITNDNDDNLGDC